MSIHDISSRYSKPLESLKDRQDTESIKAVAKEMETLFAYELIKAMRKTTGEFSKGGLGGDIYSTLFDMELARLCANQGLGIKEMLIRSLDKEKYLQKPAENIHNDLENPDLS